jgi:hypothetical protein
LEVLINCEFQPDSIYDIILFSVNNLSITYNKPSANSLKMRIEAKEQKQYYEIDPPNELFIENPINTIY